MIENNRFFQNAVRILMLLLCAFCLLPFLLLIASSFTDENTLVRNGYSLFPANVSLDAYKYLLNNARQIGKAYLNTIGVTAIGTLGNLMLTILFAYPLSRQNLPYRNLFSFIVFFTMLFNGGIVSTYIMYSQYFNIRNTYGALIIPNLLMSAFYIMMMRTNFTQNIPEEVLDAARIDGSGEWYILFKIVLPMSRPILATVALMVALQYWNDWINGLYYLTKDHYFTIQVVLNKMLQDMQFLTSNSLAAATNVDTSTMPTLGVKMAIAFIGVLPMMLIYPFFQKYFVKGITIGAVKG